MSRRGGAGRFVLIDGLRGIAALSVVLFHFREAVARSAERWLPAGIDALFRRGFLGVDVFFVISGFVIAYSIRDGKYTVGYFFRFWLRRFIRLDPPYWVAIGAELTLIALGLKFFPALETPMPSVPGVVAHFFYLQNFLGYPNILTIFWTLTYEVQFYLFVVALALIWHRVRPWLSQDGQRWLPVIALGALYIVSVTVRFTNLSSPVHGLALGRWFQFFLGVLAWWVVAGKASTKTMILAWGVLLAFVLFKREAAVEQLIAIVVSATILVAAKRDRLGTWLNAFWIQFLGKISYSLYLFHLPIGWRFISLCEMLIGTRMSMPVAWLVFLSGIGVSIATATVCYRLLEAPSIKLSKRVRLPTRRELPVPVLAGQTVSSGAPALPAGG